MNEIVVLQLAPQQVGYILDLLSTRPLREVAEMYSTISNQVTQQNAPQQAPMDFGEPADEESGD